MAREMKESNLFWIKKIPDTWVIKKVKYVSKFKAGIGHEGEWDFEGKYIIVNSRFVSTNGRKKKYTDVAHILLNMGDICIVLSDLPNGRALSRCYYIEQNNRYTLNQRVGAFYDYSMNGKYFHYIMDRNYGLLKYDDGLNQTNLQYNNVLNCPIVVPPIQEQKKIADYLDEKCTEIDSLVTDIQSQIDMLENYKKSVIVEAVTKGLNFNVEMRDSGSEWIGKIPKKWKCIKGKYIFRQRSERGNKISLELLSPTQKFGVIPQKLYEELTTNAAVKIQENTNLEMFKTIHKGDYCISLRSFQGGFEYSYYEGVVSPAYQVFYPIQNIYGGYYKYLFKGQNFINKMNSYTMSLRDGKNIAFSDFGNTYIPVPPVNEQKKIANFLDLKCEKIDNVIEDKKEQIDVLERYKKSLIYEYVTGKKEVFANDQKID